MTGRWMALAILATVALAGCSTITTKPVAAPPPSTTAAASAVPTSVPDYLMTMQARLGDLRTLDPCSLVDVDALPADLHAELAPRESLDYCTIDITAGGQNAELDVGTLIEIGSRGDQPAQPLGHDLYELTGTLSNGTCVDHLVYNDDSIQLTLQATTNQGTGTDALCQAANAAAQDVGTILTSTMTPKHVTVPKNSLALLSACTTLNATTVQDLHLVEQAPRPAGHACVWSPYPNPNPALGDIVNFVLGPPPNAPYVSAADGRSTIDGLETYRYQATDTDTSTCWLDTARIPFGSPSDDLVEIAEVQVIDGPGQLSAACATAATIATVAWKTLPPLS